MGDQPVITKPRVMLREVTQLRQWAEVAEWFASRPAGRWYSLEEVENSIPIRITIASIQPLCMGWVEAGWLEMRSTTTGVAFRGSAGMPGEDSPWGRVFAGLLELTTEIG